MVLTVDVLLRGENCWTTQEVRVRHFQRTLRSPMSLRAFSFPFPETRFLRAGRLLYRFQIRAGSSFSGEEMMAENISQELEDIIRTVLGNLDSLQPFSSAHFNVFPYKKQWEGASKVMCKHSEKTLRAYPFIVTLYVEKNTENEKQAEKSKRCTGNPPPEDTILQDLSEDTEAEGKVSVIQWLNMNNPLAEEMALEDFDTIEMKFINPKMKSQHSTVTRSGGPGKALSENTKDNEEEQQWDEEGENTDCGPGNCERSGILTRLASTILSFSGFFKDP